MSIWDDFFSTPGALPERKLLVLIPNTETVRGISQRKRWGDPTNRPDEVLITGFFFAPDTPEFGASLGRVQSQMSGKLYFSAALTAKERAALVPGNRCKLTDDTSADLPIWERESTALWEITSFPQMYEIPGQWAAGYVVTVQAVEG
ncbi:hypothetical protein HMPREF3152_00305 [Actinomyces sp. HMSC06A08]|uniref:Uncharacterized protein n=1 Tax=Winkia neuii TaxID=33007 RepID=A0A2I1IMR0_9ACTO|nr:hypothetical protein [Winkia neuii]OFJ69639.1 hypothetical protein HMPREF2851_00565 [Actinomyces sp. HMSC064C12]OFT56989.1 hypothetical protein HMPREF3152_00305 [Actinomyces sp. HMSC06A08]PKY72372.1 hypothetical protein CYJ19_05890 [Winkia neuii]